MDKPVDKSVDNLWTTRIIHRLSTGHPPDCEGVWNFFGIVSRGGVYTSLTKNF